MYFIGSPTLELHKIQKVTVNGTEGWEIDRDSFADFTIEAYIEFIYTDLDGVQRQAGKSLWGIDYDPGPFDIANVSIFMQTALPSTLSDYTFTGHSSAIAFAEWQEILSGIGTFQNTLHDLGATMSINQEEMQFGGHPPIISNGNWGYPVKYTGVNGWAINAGSKTLVCPTSVDPSIRLRPDAACAIDPATSYFYGRSPSATLTIDHMILPFIDINSDRYRVRSDLYWIPFIIEYTSFQHEWIITLPASVFLATPQEGLIILPAGVYLAPGEEGLITLPADVILQQGGGDKISIDNKIGFWIRCYSEWDDDNSVYRIVQETSRQSPPIWEDKVYLTGVDVSATFPNVTILDSGIVTMVYLEVDSTGTRTVKYITSNDLGKTYV
jgi:hypothetical protein